MARQTITKRFLSLDTTFVLFFLAVELARVATFFTFDTLLLAVTAMMVLVLPFFLLDEEEAPAFSSWLSRRSMIAVAGILVGVGFRTSVGTLLPQSFGGLPMTLLILSAVVCCYFQIYSLMKLRLVK